MSTMLKLPPLSLYVHIPWCVQKCPYCDFNSHALKQDIPESSYIAALLDDLSQDLPWVQGRELTSIFIGGGTPSLFSSEGIQQLLAGIQQQIPFSADIEITLEANPGTVEAGRFSAYQQAGVTRISIGVQSFQPEKLLKLGRIHDPQQAINAGHQATQSHLRSFNIDLMHGLPDQSVEDALSDLHQAIEISPPHLSWYQLTIEPNTAFGSRPPVLPEDETLWDIQEQGHQKLLEAGYQQYEISAYAKTDYQCRHNLNYWQFGDYLGIGCGAHGKITLPHENKIIRTSKVKHPKGYLDLTRSYLDQQWHVEPEDRPFEYFMNRMRLFTPIPKTEFEARTGLDASSVEPLLKEAYAKELLENHPNEWKVTLLGHRYLNSLLSMLMGDE